MKIVTELQFPMGVPSDPTTIRNALNQHPLLVGAARQPLSAFVWGYRQWLANGRAMDLRAAAKVDVKFSDAMPLPKMLNYLLDYMGAGKETITAARLLHDCTYETLTPEHFVHATETADDLRFVTQSLKASALRSLVAATRGRSQPPTGGDPQTPLIGNDIEEFTNLKFASFALAKWIDNAMHSSLLGVLYEDDEVKRNQLYSEFGQHAPKIKDIRTAIEKINKRITKEQRKDCPPDPPSQLKGLVCKGESPIVDLADPNIAIHSAIKNSLLANACGLVTSWTVEAAGPVYGEQDYVIQLDISSLNYDKAKVDVQSPLPTAFRRIGHTHPVSYGDIGSPETHNCVLACLNNSSGQARYRATSVNAEIGLVKQLILQSKNSLPGPSANAESNFGRFDSRDPETLDLRVPQLLQNDRFGTPEPETSGVIFSAPPEDLIMPKALQFSSPEDRRAALPCLFLEDLWIGYRLDVKQKSKEKFTSIHKQEQQITFTQTTTQVKGTMEDYIEREQKDDPALGHSSTDLTTYNGLSSGQAKDYLILLGVNRPPDNSQRQPFTAEIKGYEKAERLTFGTTYEYRFRNVFTGGVSCDCSDAALDSNGFSKKYRQQFPFFRARALRPGEILTVRQDDQEAVDGGGRTIYLSSKQPRAAVVIVPSPIDVDTSRFHGLLLASKDEVNTQRKYVTDVGAFFNELPPTALNYFYDPDVYGVIIRAKVVNGDERFEAEGMSYSDGTYCRLVKHLDLDPITEAYGKKGNWQKFKPILISFRTSKESVARMRKGESSRHIEVLVPPATELHLSILPLFDPSLLSKTASYVASSVELQDNGLNVTEAASFPIPSVAEQIVKVIHAVKEPRNAPKLTCESPRRAGDAAKEQEFCVARRQLDSEFGVVVGHIELDAASTKEVRLEATWTDIKDDPSQEKYVLEAGKAVSTPRSVVFREYDALYPSIANFREYFLSGSAEQPSKSLANFRIGTSTHDFSDQFVLQCVEDKVFLGEVPGEQQTNVAGISNRIDFKDQRRKFAKVQAVAVGRFAQKFAPDPAVAERRSNSVLVEVPSTIKMTGPRVSHIVPLRREFLDGDRKSGSRAATFGIRIYLRKEWCQSGIGERLAIGCAAGGEPGSPDGGDILKYVTQWGEDPIELAGLSSTTRMPRASDFVVPKGDVDGDDLDENLYPRNVIGGRSPVIYRDNVVLAPSDPGGKDRWVSIASYALRYDQAQRLWYADVQIEGDFFGRCGIALYRHQPHALGTRELSSSSAWVYAAVLYGEPVAWSEKEDNLHVTIGPIYDSSVSFELDSLKYHNGVSEKLADQRRVLHPLKSYRVGKALYFEALVPKKDFDWGLFKKRFGYPVSSSRLRD